MSNAIRMLETMGSDAKLRHAAKSTVYNALNAANVDPDAQWAILRGDTIRLEALLGARTGMICSQDGEEHVEERIEQENSVVLVNAA